jgi:DNA polymerase I-like protein with 3'-5' exonuclease and polymerase domains
MSWKKFRVYAFVEYGVRFTEDESKFIRERFFSQEAYHGLSLWHQDTKVRYKDVPIVTTIAGYQIPLEYNGEYDSFAGPAALNYQVQNPCAAGNKRALHLLWKELRGYMHKKDRWTGPMLCRTVHDENHIESPASMSDVSCRLLERCMTDGMNKVFRRDDLVSVEAASGQSWADKA